MLTLTDRPFSDASGHIKMDFRVGETFVEYDAVVVLVPRKQYQSEEHRRKEWQEAMAALAGSCPDLFNPRDPDRRCPTCNGVGYLWNPESDSAAHSAGEKNND